MTVDQFSAQLDAFGEEALDLTSILNDIARDITNEIRAKAPVDTSKLKGSIRSQIDQNGFEITMLPYGAFQNYGVSGTQDSFGTKVPKELFSPRPSSGDTYKFGVRTVGLKRQEFFNMDEIQEEIAERVAEALTNNFN